MGNGESSPEEYALHKALVCCYKLFHKFLKATAAKFIPQCEGIFGTIEALTIDPTYQGVVIIIVIVLDLARVDEEAKQVDIRINKS